MPPILANLLPLAVNAFFGKKDSSTGEVIAKGLLTSKTMQGGIGLAVIPTMIFPLVDDAMGPPWSAWTKLILMVAAFAWLTYGRATAQKPLGGE